MEDVLNYPGDEIISVLRGASFAGGRGAVLEWDEFDFGALRPN